MGNIFLLMIDFHAYGTFPWVFPEPPSTPATGC